MHLTQGADSRCTDGGRDVVVSAASKTAADNNECYKVCQQLQPLLPAGLQGAPRITPQAAAAAGMFGRQSFYSLCSTAAAAPRRGSMWSSCRTASQRGSLWSSCRTASQRGSLWSSCTAAASPGSNVSHQWAQSVEGRLRQSSRGGTRCSVRAAGVPLHPSYRPMLPAAGC